MAIDDFDNDLFGSRAPDEDDDDQPMDGYFDDSGERLNPDLIVKPGLCLLCANDNVPDEEVLCNLTRLDQREDKGFECGAFKPKKEK